MTYYLDKFVNLYCRRVHFFQKGWGDKTVLENLANQPLQFEKHIPQITWKKLKKDEQHTILLGQFLSPHQNIYFPKESHTAYLEWIIPANTIKNFPIYLHFAATGDQKFERRYKRYAMPLIPKGISSIILENPYYGKRRPAKQKNFSLRFFIDLWNMSLATIHEGLSLLHWLYEEGFTYLGVTGVSMGGYMASAVGAFYQQPLAIVPILSPHSAYTVFLDGTLHQSCAWDALHLEKNLNKKYLYDLFKQTDLTNYSPPHVKSQILILAAKKDAYVPSYSPQKLHQHWQGSKIHWLNTGHVGAFLFYNKIMINNLSTAMHNLQQEWQASR